MDEGILIVIVEDDPVIRDLLALTVEEAGYTVATAQDGDEAIALLDKRTGECRALITDVRLSRGKHKLTGWDVARHARELNPAIPVVFISGDSAGDWSAQGVPKSLMLSKPFAMAQVVTAVSQLLNEAG